MTQHTWPDNMNMVERIARSIASADGSDPDGRLMRGDPPYWMDRIEEAKAALTALRTLTDVMRKATARADGFDEAWEAAIDAALAERG